MKWTVLLLLFFPKLLLAQVDSFHTQWADTTKAIIIDAYYLNAIDWPVITTDQRLVGVIHKASQGTETDTHYLARRDSALSHGLCWGSYHLGTSGGAIEQAQHYLNLVGTDSCELRALDLESLENRHMSLDSAVVFINYIHAQTGQYPFVYCNHNVLSAISREYSDSSVFSQCPLWYARFRDDIPNFTNNTWDCYTIWQFSCEINCRTTGQCVYNVPGTAFDMDINVSRLSVDEARFRWPHLE